MPGALAAERRGAYFCCNVWWKVFGPCFFFPLSSWHVKKRCTCIIYIRLRNLLTCRFSWWLEFEPCFLVIFEGHPKGMSGLHGRGRSRGGMWVSGAIWPRGKVSSGEGCSVGKEWKEVVLTDLYTFACLIGRGQRHWLALPMQMGVVRLLGRIQLSERGVGAWLEDTSVCV